MPPWDFGILAIPGFVLSLPLGLLLGRRLCWVIVASLVGAAAFVGIGAWAVLDAMRDPYPLAWTTRENAGLIAAWCVMSALGWLFGIAIGAGLRLISWRELEGRVKQRLNRRPLAPKPGGPEETGDGVCLACGWGDVVHGAGVCPESVR